MIIHLKTIGVILIALAFIHGVFPKKFNWDKELKTLSLINKQMMLVHTFFIALTVMLMGILCLTSAQDLVETNLGKKIALGLGIFWSLRLVIQFFGYSANLWKGKLFETTVHIVATVLWVYLSVVFIWVYLG